MGREEQSLASPVPWRNLFWVMTDANTGDTSFYQLNTHLHVPPGSSPPARMLKLAQESTELVPVGRESSLTPQLSSPFHGHGVVLLPSAVPRHPVSPGPSTAWSPKPCCAVWEPGRDRDPILQSSALFQQCPIC